MEGFNNMISLFIVLLSWDQFSLQFILGSVTLFPLRISGFALPLQYGNRPLTDFIAF